MRLDIQKLDERIKKLLELRKIAADTEMAQFLSEFLVPEDALSAASMPPHVSSEALPYGDGVSDFVKGVLDGKESPSRTGSGVTWSTRKV